MAKEKIKTISVIPFSEPQDMKNSVGRIGELQRMKAELKTNCDSAIAKLKEELSESVKPLDEEITILSHSVKLYSDTNRNQIFDEKKKSLDFPQGKISYRQKPDSVPVKTSKKLVEEILTRNELLDYREKVLKKFASVFLRVDLELDKENILRSPADALLKTGIEIAEGGEIFTIEAANSTAELEVA